MTNREHVWVDPCFAAYSQLHGWNHERSRPENVPHYHGFRIGYHNQEISLTERLKHFIRPTEHSRAFMRGIEEGKQVRDSHSFMLGHITYLYRNYIRKDNKDPETVLDDLGDILQELGDER